MRQLELLDEERLLDVIDADHLRVAAGEDARTVGGVTQGRKKSFSFLKKLKKIGLESRISLNLKIK